MCMPFSNFFCLRYMLLMQIILRIVHLPHIRICTIIMLDGAKPRTCECRDLKEISGELAGCRDPMNPKLFSADAAIYHKTKCSNWLNCFNILIIYSQQMTSNPKVTKLFIFSPNLTSPVSVIYMTGWCECS